MRQLTNEEHGRLDVDGFKAAPKSRVILILDNVRSLQNIGSIFRSCDAFRIEKLILCGISTPPPHRDIHKSALGAELAVDWEYVEHTLDAVESVKQSGYGVYAIEQTTQSILLGEFHPSLPVALIFGHEIRGVAPEVLGKCDGAVEIPQFGTKHSFNVAVSAGIVLWEILGQEGRKAGRQEGKSKGRSY